MPIRKPPIAISWIFGHPASGTTTVSCLITSRLIRFSWQPSDFFSRGNHLRFPLFFVTGYVLFPVWSLRNLSVSNVPLCEDAEDAPCAAVDHPDRT
jgi:hypothetical protein